MRTWLFAPGHETRKVAKALASDADGTILDWEDAVPAQSKSAARVATLAALEQIDPQELPHVCVRVNHPDSPHFSDDAAALEGVPVGSVMVPKVEDPEQVMKAAVLDSPLVLILESARGILAAGEIARCHPDIRYLAFGPLDLLADLGGHWTAEGEETLYARSKVPIAARAGRLVGALDGPYPKLGDIDGLRRDTERARRMGYVGRLLIHPEQIAPVSDVFSPTEDELRFARRVLEASAAAKEQGRGALQVDGRFIDPPVLRWAQRVVDEACG